MAAKARLRLDGADPINGGLLRFLTLTDGAGALATDISPLRRNALLNNFGASGWQPSPYGKSLTFDGVNDYVNINSRPLNNLPQGSFCVRLKPNAGGGVVAYEDGGGYNNFAMFCPTPGSDVVRFNIGSNADRNSASRTWVATTWYDVVVTWGAEIKIYINGVLDTTIAASGGTKNTTGDNDQLGRYSYGGGTSGLYSPCSMSGVRIYNRAITPSEVARLHREPWAGTARPWRRSYGTTGTTYNLTTGALSRTYAVGAALFSIGRRIDTGGLSRAYTVGDAGFTVRRTLQADAIPYTYRVPSVALNYYPAQAEGDTHDGFIRRSRRQRAMDAAERRRRDEAAQEAVALRLSLEAAMGLAAEAVEDAPQPVADVVETATREAARFVPMLARAPDPEVLQAANEAIVALRSAIAAADRARMLAEDDEDVLMLLRAL